MALNAIAATLNREQVPTVHGGPWRHTTLARVVARAERGGTP